MGIAIYINLTNCCFGSSVPTFNLAYAKPGQLGHIDNYCCAIIVAVTIQLTKQGSQM